MKIKKKSILFVVMIIVITVVAFFACSKFFELISTEHGIWLINYGINVPKPKTEIHPFYKSGPMGDKEIYTICEYNYKSFQKLAGMGLWKSVSSQTDINLINADISLIKEMLTGDGGSCEEVFTKYPIEVKKGYLYYLKPKEQNGFLLLIANTDDRKLYALELTN